MPANKFIKSILGVLAALLLIASGYFGSMLFVKLSEGSGSSPTPQSSSAVTTAAKKRTARPETETSTTSCTTQTTSALTSGAETVPQTENTESATESAPFLNELSDFLHRNGFNDDEVGSSGQIITVESSGSSCKVRMYERQSGNWSVFLETSGAVGRNGVSANSFEGDFCTPRGIIPLGFAFGTQPVSGLKTEYRLINSNSCWVDDPESPLYNQWVESETINWKSAEHLADYPAAYKYAVVIEYNTSPVIPYRGSAIFLHCAAGPYTAGCVAVPEEDMLSILRELDPASSPIIIIA